MSLVLKQPFRQVVIEGQEQNLKVTDVPMQTLRDAINKDEVISLREVMYGAARMMHYPYHTTPYDLKLYVLPHFENLVQDIDYGRVQAYTMPDNSRIWEEHYIHSRDALAAFDIPAMPCPDADFIYYSKYDSVKKNVDGLFPRDFRRAFLVAIGDARPQSAAVEQGMLIPYQIRSPKEWEEHFERLVEIRRPARPQMQVWGWAEKMWDALEKYDINPNPDKKPKQDKDPPQGDGSDDPDISP